MFSIIQSMENQLKKVLTINTSLEKDLKASREVISDLKEERSKLTKTINDLEEEIPLKRELQAGIDRLIEERNSAQPLLREIRNTRQFLETQNSELTGKIESYKNEIDGIEVVIASIYADGADMYKRFIEVVTKSVYPPAFRLSCLCCFQTTLLSIIDIFPAKFRFIC